MRVRKLERFVIIVVLSSASSALAEPNTTPSAESTDRSREEAAEAFWAGKREYEAGNFDAAAANFGKAYSLTRDPEVLFDTAQAYRKAGKCESALQSYEQFLLEGKASASFARAEKLVAELRETCKPTSTEATASTAAPLSPASAEPQQAPQVRPTAPHFTSGESKNESTIQPSKARNLTFVMSMAALGTGLVAGGIATGLVIWNHDRRQHWEAQDADLAKGLASNETPQAWAARQGSNDALAHSITRVNNEALAFGIGAGALLATSAVLFYSSTKAEPEKAASRPENMRFAAGIGPRRIEFSVSW